jgi:hypothetical protein
MSKTNDKKQKHDETIPDYSGGVPSDFKNQILY